MSEPKLFEELLLLQAYFNTYRGGERKGSGIPVRAQGSAGDMILPAAVLGELAVAGRIHVKQADPGLLRASKDSLVVTDPIPLGDVETDTVLEDCAMMPGRSVESGVRMTRGSRRHSSSPPWPPKSNLRRRVLDRLAEQGMLRVYQRKLLWVFPVRSYPIADPTPATDAKARLDALVEGADPDVRTAALALFVIGPGKIRPFYGYMETNRRQPGKLEELRQKLYDGDWGEESLRLTIRSLVGLTVNTGTSGRNF